MADLLYTNKIAYANPTGSFEEKVERFNVDSYSVRASIGINPSAESWDIEWRGLTTVEAKALKALFQTAKGVSVITWQSDLGNAVQKWTCSEHKATPVEGPVARWTYNATLNLEYDN